MPDWGAVTRRVPTIVTRTDLTVHSGDRRIDLVHPGHAAHTGGDLVAWLPEERVLFTGDLLFVGLTPLVFAGSVDGALRRPRVDRRVRARRRGARARAGDHGPPTCPAVLADHERYYRFVLDLAADGRGQGLTPLERRPGRRSRRRSPTGPTPSGWSSTCTGPTPTPTAAPWTWWPPCTTPSAWNGGPLTTHVCCLA